jgi:hypothetical protein
MEGRWRQLGRRPLWLRIRSGPANSACSRRRERIESAAADAQAVSQTKNDHQTGCNFPAYRQGPGSSALNLTDAPDSCSFRSA